MVSFCRNRDISQAGGKSEIFHRIERYLATGEVVRDVGKKLTISKFDWNNSKLNLNTKLTDNYKNTENERDFMTLQTGQHFRFNTQFMNWAKANEGKSLKEAIDEWNRIYTHRKDKGHKTDIDPQFEYNRYIRDFLADNPGHTITSAIHFWKLKCRQPGDNNYSETDLFLFEESIV